MGIREGHPAVSDGGCLSYQAPKNCVRRSISTPHAQESSAPQDPPPLRRSASRPYPQVRGKEAISSRPARPSQDRPEKDKRVPPPARGKAEGALQLRRQRGPAASLYGARPQDAGPDRRQPARRSRAPAGQRRLPDG